MNYTKKISLSVLFFTLQILFGHQIFAQNFKKIGVKITPEKNWKNSSDASHETDKSFRLVAQDKTAIMEVYNLGKASSEEASMKTIEVLKDRSLKPADFQKAKQRKQKIGKTEFVIFEDIIKTPLESQNMVMSQWWGMYLCEISGKKIIVFSTEFYKEGEGKEKTKVETEKMLKSLK